MARKTFRTGVQTLWRDTARQRWFVRCHNRTYDSGYIEIPDEKVVVWGHLLGAVSSKPGVSSPTPETFPIDG